MTSVRQTAERGPDAAEAAPVAPDPCLARLHAVIDAAGRLGLPVTEADAVRATATERLGFPSDAYVVALVGGTGVGKSSLLNALAGATISPATVRRPTTSRPIAWLPADHRPVFAPLLAWLDVEPEDVHVAAPGEVPLAILDLPDLDSTSTDHRQRVEAILPRVDAVIWVTDPEKYADAILHDDFLRTWLPRLGRQVIVLNKADRLSAADGVRVQRDLERDIRGLLRPGVDGGTVTVIRTAVPPASAGLGHADRGPRNGERNGAGDDARDDPGIAPLRRWLAAEGDAKSIVRARIRASIRDAARALGVAAGVADTDASRPLLDPAARSAALEDTRAALIRVVDLGEARRQAVAATRAAARGRGAGPLGGLTSLVYRWSGRAARVADPGGFLARWRDRGSLRPAVEPIRAALAEPLRRAPPPIRARLATAFDAGAVEASLGRSVDRAIGTSDRPAPRSLAWPVLGSLQTVVTLGLVATAAWVVLWVLVRFPVDSIALPLVGRVPIPLVVLIALLAAGYLVARLLGAHAGWLGRRWADDLAAEIGANLARDVDAAAFGDLDAIDADRAALARAIAAVEGECQS
jgi:energy-coupling factor transporter ATP-binding protein EcfA2